MSDICGFDITPDPFTTLRKMQKMELDQYMEQFEAISGGATKEFSLEKAMAKMQEEWEPIEVRFNPYANASPHRCLVVRNPVPVTFISKPMVFF